MSDAEMNVPGRIAHADVLIGVSLAGWITRSFGTRNALLVCAGFVAAAGVLALIWGRGGRAEGRPVDATRAEGAR